jgi:hypothetical protein
MAFLGGGFVPLGPDEDGPAAMAIVIVPIDMHDGTFEILSR